MKVVLNILCWILVALCVYFPFAYFHSEMDKQEVKISHILVNTKEEATDLKAKINKEKTFEELAEQYSLCESKADKGNIGYNMRGRLLPEFEKSAFSLDENVISEPVQTQEGWHLIKITDIKYFSDKDNLTRKYNYETIKFFK